MAAAVTTRWVTLLCARHKTKSVKSMTSRRTACCPLPSHRAPRWPFAIWGCVSPTGISLMFKQVNGTWIITLGGEDWEDRERNTQRLVCCRPLITRGCWEGQGHQLLPAGLWEGLSSPTSCFLPLFSFLPLIDTWLKEKKGKTGACSWSVHFNGQKPDLSHVIKSS